MNCPDTRKVVDVMTGELNTKDQFKGRIRQMRLLVLTLALVLIPISFTSSTACAGIDTRSPVAAYGANQLEERHQLELKLGIWNQIADARVDITDIDVSTSVGSSGLLAGISYGYWLQEGLALNIGTSVLFAKVESTVGIPMVLSETATVTNVLFGLKRYFPVSSYGSPVRPFVRAAVGPFIGQQTYSEVGLVVATESRSEVTLGGQAAIGADFILSRKVMVGLMLGYNLMADFDEPIGGSKNYGGPEMSFGFSFLLGRGTH